MDNPGAGRARYTATVGRAAGLARNARLLGHAALQHAVDDPVLLVVQVTRRLPPAPRTALGRVLEKTKRVLPGVGALGAMMSGRADAAEKILTTRANMGSSRLAGEVAVMLDRADLLPADAPAPTRARALWARGDLSAALLSLERTGRGAGRYAGRLRSELDLLEPGAFVTPSGREPEAEKVVPSPARIGRLRVLHLLTNSLPHTQSGYSLRSHRILTALRERGIESVALTRTGYPVMVGLPLARDEDVVDGVRYVRTLPRRLPRTQEQRVQAEIDRALALVEEFRPHVLHTTTNYLNAHVARSVSRITGLPWVFEVRGLMEQTWIASHRTDEGREAAASSEKTRLIAACEGDFARSADAVVTLSETMAREIQARGVDMDSITLVPNGVDAALLEQRMAPVEARSSVGLDLPPAAFVVGAVSALVDYEGFDVLLRAAAQLIHGGAEPNLRERLHVVLVGDGASAPMLRELAAELQIEDRVRFPGRVPHSEAPIWVQVLDVVVVPRLDREVSRSVTPQKPVEAGALGRPVIVSDLPALRETMTDEVGELCGVVFPAGDELELARAIAALAARDSVRERLAHRARAMAANRTWSEQMRRYVRVYSTVIGRREEESARGE